MIRRQHQPSPAPFAVLIGDEVETVGGLLGQVVAIEDDTVHLLVDTEVTVMVTLVSIVQVWQRRTPVTPAPTPTIDNWLQQIRAH